MNTEDNLTYLHNMRGELSNSAQVDAMNAYIIGAVTVYIEPELWQKIVIQAVDWAGERK